MADTLSICPRCNSADVAFVTSWPRSWCECCACGFKFDESPVSASTPGDTVQSSEKPAGASEADDDLKRIMLGSKRAATESIQQPQNEPAAEMQCEKCHQVISEHEVRDAHERLNRWKLDNSDWEIFAKANCLPGKVRRLCASCLSRAKDGITCHCCGIPLNDAEEARSAKYLQQWAAKTPNWQMIIDGCKRGDIPMSMQVWPLIARLHCDPCWLKTMEREFRYQQAMKELPITQKALNALSGGGCALLVVACLTALVIASW